MIEIDGNHLQIQTLVQVARKRVKVRMSDDARQAMLRSYQWVKDSSQVREQQYSNESTVNRSSSNQDEHMAIYGVNTGFGSLARIRIPPQDSSRLSVNLIRSHAAGVGEFPVYAFRCL